MLKNYFKMIVVLASFFMCAIVAQDDFSDEAVNDSDQKISISGKITDSKTGEPIPGANVFILDSDIGSASDADGNYSIEEIVSGSNYGISHRVRRYVFIC